MARKKIDTLLGRIREILRVKLKGDTIIDVSESGIRDNIHVLVISRALDAYNETQKQELLWDYLEKSGLKKAELARISLILPLSVAELRR